MEKKIDVISEARKMASMMERATKHQTYTDAMLSEALLLESAKRVNFDTLEQFMTKYQPHEGKFASLAYIQMYKAGGLYPSDELYDKLGSDEVTSGFEERGREHHGKFMDKMQNLEWSNPQGRAYNGNKSFKDNIYQYVIKLTKYRINWQSPEKFGEKDNEFLAQQRSLEDKMSDNLKGLFNVKPPVAPTDDAEEKKSRAAYRPVGDLASYGLYTFTDADKNPVKGQYFDNDTPVDYERTAIKNYLSSVDAQTSYYYGVDANGNIDPISKTLFYMLYRKGGNKYDLSQVSAEEMELAQQYADLLSRKERVYKQFKGTNVAYICCFAKEMGGNNESVYWVNPSPKFLEKKQKNKVNIEVLNKNVNMSELVSILDKHAKFDSENPENFANINV